MKKGWMVRAGSGGFLFDDFEKEQAVAIGWPKLNDLSQYPNLRSINLLCYIQHDLLSIATHN